MYKRQQAETAITEANTTLEKATEKADTAKREADTATAKAKEASDSAEAAGLSKDKAEMAANTAVTKAQEVQTNVDAAVELKELSLQAAITATDKAAESNASAERAESSTTLILQAEATVTKTAAQVKADAKTAADSKDIAVSEATKATEKASQADASAKEVQRIVEGLGGFDGTAEHVLAIDTQGIAGDAGGTSNVQALLNVLAQKVALELVSNSALATMLSGYIAKSCIKNTGLVTEEGFVADARQLNPEIADTLAARVKKNAEDIVTANSNLDITNQIAEVENSNAYIQQSGNGTRSVYKHGNLIHLRLGIVVTTGTTSTVTIARIPYTSTDSTSVLVPTWATYQSPAFLTVSVDTGGNIIIRGTQSGVYVADLIYFASNL